MTSNVAVSFAVNIFQYSIVAGSQYSDLYLKKKKEKDLNENVLVPSPSTPFYSPCHLS